MIIPIEKSIVFTNPELLDEWHHELNDSINPESLTGGSGRKVWWKCRNNSEHKPWIAAIKDRAGRYRKPTGCPECKKEKPNLGFQKVPYEKSLAFISPEISKEWHKNLNGEITPNIISNGSSKKVWWQCETFKEHIWDCRVKDRTRQDINRRTNCPKCNNQSSVPEVRILSELEFIFKNVISRKKFNDLEIDIFLPDLSIGIEYDGYYYHLNKTKKDKRKNQVFEEKGVTIFRFRQGDLDKISDKDIFVEEPLKKNDLDKLITQIFNLKEIDNKFLLISKNDYLNANDFLNEKSFRTYIAYFPSPLPQNSLALTHPEISDEWHFERNHPLTPKNFSSGSSQVVWWQCKKFSNHIYPSPIKGRIRGRGCNICAGKNLIFENSLSYKTPEVAKEWHPTLNGEITPELVSNGSAKIIWWQCCINNAHIWKCSVKDRTRKDKRRVVCKICKK